MPAGGTDWPAHQPCVYELNEIFFTVFILVVSGNHENRKTGATSPLHSIVQQRKAVILDETKEMFRVAASDV